MKNRAFQKYALDPEDKLMIELLEEILEQLVEVNTNIKKLLGSQPSPS